jgi:hypothetical protein
MENTIAALIAMTEAAERRKRRDVDALRTCSKELTDALREATDRALRISTACDPLPRDDQGSLATVVACNTIMSALIDERRRLMDLYPALDQRLQLAMATMLDDEGFRNTQLNLKVLRPLQRMAALWADGKFSAYMPGHAADEKLTIDFITGLRHRGFVEGHPAALLAAAIGEDAVTTIRGLERKPCKLVFKYTSDWRAAAEPAEFKLASVVVSCGGVSMSSSISTESARSEIVADHIASHAAGAKEMRDAAGRCFSDFQVIEDGVAFYDPKLLK